MKLNQIVQQIEALTVEIEAINEMAHTARIGGHNELFFKFVAEISELVKQKRTLQAQKEAI